MCTCKKDYFGDGMYCYSESNTVLRPKINNNVAISQQVQLSVSSALKIYPDITMDPKNVDAHQATTLNQRWEDVKVSHIIFLLMTCVYACIHE